VPFSFFAAMYPTQYFRSIDSTNIKAKEIAEQGAISGSAVVAEYQTNGRGRLGKEWHSVKGKGLYCSIVVRPKIALEDYPKITLVAGLSVAMVLDRITARKSQLKWPNDIYFRGKKVSGILTESSSLSSSSQDRYAVVGIGVNVHHVEADFPPELREMVTSLFLETGNNFVVKEIFQAVRQELLQQLQLFSTDGFQPLLSQWRKKDYLLGKEMECVSSAGKKIRGIGLGPDDQGQLHVRDTNGHIHEVLSGDVRLATS
jgi:BirA family biotin operon repressor/biotin-[acetyl-CoA-carboxylase] ligase